MKKIIFILLFAVASVALYANPICYFTYSQARRTVNYLNKQNELVIYCGHEYELETYVIVSDIWLERANSRYYEVWLYGIDAYTGDEIYMPLDLSCVWLLNHWTNEMYNAARYLHFQCDAPYTTLVWSMPVYTGFVRVAHPTFYRRSYHYEIHRYGWHPVSDIVLPAYYMRPPTAPMPVVVGPYVPGRERPTVRIDNTLPSRPQPTTTRTASTPTRSNGATTQPTNPAPTNNNSNRSTSTPSTNRTATQPARTPTQTRSTSQPSGVTTRTSSTSSRTGSATTTTTPKPTTNPSRTTSNRTQSVTTRQQTTTQKKVTTTPKSGSSTTSSSRRTASTPTRN